MSHMRFAEMVGRFHGTAQVVGVPTPKPVYEDGHRTERQRTDADGRLLWSLPVLFMPSDMEADRAEVVNATIASDVMPETAPGTPVDVSRGVRVSCYGTDRGGVGYAVYLKPSDVRPQAQAAQPAQVAKPAPASK